MCKDQVFLMQLRQTDDEFPSKVGIIIGGWALSDDLWCLLREWMNQVEG